MIPRTRSRCRSEASNSEDFWSSNPSRTEAPGHKKNLATRKQFCQRLSNRIRIGNSASFLDPQAQGENFARDEYKMGVLHISQ